MKKVKAKIKLFPHQIDFVTSEYKFTALIGGFRSGKSYSIPFRCLYLLKKRDYAIIVVVSPSYRMSRDIIEPIFFEVFEKYKIKYSYSKTDRKYYVENENLVGEIWLRSGDNPASLTGITITDFILDEFDKMNYMSQVEVWKEMIARISKGKGTSGAITTTPEGFKYTYELCVEKKIVHRIKAKTSDNQTLEDDYIKSLFDNYSREQVVAYINGEFVNLNEGVICYNFNKTVNCKELKGISSDTIHIGMDFNVAKMCAVVCIIDNNTTKGKIIYQIDEITLRNSGTEGMILAIKNRFPNKNIFIYPDATSHNRNVIAPDIDSLRRLQSNFGVLNVKTLKSNPSRQPINPPVKDSIEILNGFMKNANDFIGFYVDTKCKESIKDYEQCVWKNENIDKSTTERSGHLDAMRYVAYLSKLDIWSKIKR